ncbi:hypothetical protein [Aeromonas dhakensis]|uniref:hypothetical protein n=1 Tax=Aeromonas dhakensis TaxID=196024 RepID=UPI00036BA9BE
MLKITITSLSNILAFMFMRHTFRENFILFIKILSISFLCSVLFGVPLATNIITLDTELWPVIEWATDQLMSFINIQKMTYIGITYFFALVVNLLAKEIVASQSKRTQLTREFLVEELRCNTRAVIITMSNALSLTFKILVGLSLILAVLTNFGVYEDGTSLKFEAMNILYQSSIFIILDCALFIVQRFLLSFNDKNKNCLTSQADETA